jgi:flagellar biosynthesis protein FlhB
VAEGEQPSEDKTEAATQRHTEQARESGQAAVSPEVVTFMSLSAVVLIVGYQSQAAMRHFLALLATILPTQVMLTCCAPPNFV